jgi:hypothetical protein
VKSIKETIFLKAKVLNASERSKTILIVLPMSIAWKRFAIYVDSDMSKACDTLRHGKTTQRYRNRIGLLSSVRCLKRAEMESWRSKRRVERSQSVTSRSSHFPHPQPPARGARLPCSASLSRCHRDAHLHSISIAQASSIVQERSIAEETPMTPIAAPYVARSHRLLS